MILKELIFLYWRLWIVSILNGKVLMHSCEIMLHIPWLNYSRFTRVPIIEYIRDLLESQKASLKDVSWPSSVGPYLTVLHLVISLMVVLESLYLGVNSIWMLYIMFPLLGRWDYITHNYLFQKRQTWPVARRKNNVPVLQYSCGRKQKASVGGGGVGFIYLSLRKNRTVFASRLWISLQPNSSAFILQCHVYM